MSYLVHSSIIYIYKKRFDKQKFLREFLFFFFFFKELHEFNDVFHKNDKTGTEG